MTSKQTATAASMHSFNRYTSARTAVMGLVKISFLGLGQLSSATAAPLKRLLHVAEDLPKSPDDPNLWLYLGTAVILVLLGGAFAGLTIALMGQDGIYLQVIATSGEGKEQKHAESVYRLLQRGKHWVLVTLLLSNVIVNETLPIVLDRSLGGGWPAVLGSTALIVIFGEVIPQSICVRYGLQIGAFMSLPVLLLMYLLAPIAWPTAKLLDWLLGEEQGTVYKKSGLKTLVTLHKTLGSSPSDRLNQDEVTIISAVLDLKDKPVGDIQTPMEDVFIMSSDTVLDEKTMDIILSAGYSRIPIHEPGNDRNFIGMLLVKILITYDPEDCKRVGEFALATLPETRPETSCLDIVNFFQEGKSHMVLVSESPGEDQGATGVVTLEDVIEELIGEEIIDESDVYIDVHKAIRRMAPAPKARVQKGHAIAEPDALTGREDHLIDFEEADDPKPRERLGSTGSRVNVPTLLNLGKEAALKMRRRSSNNTDGSTYMPIPFKGSIEDMRQHLKHLGPSNLASRPKSTRYNSVKIKPGTTKPSSDAFVRQHSITEELYRDDPDPHSGEGEGLLNSAGKDASDAVQAVRLSYGATDKRSSENPITKNKSIQANVDRPSENQQTSPEAQKSMQRSSSEGSDTMGSLPSTGSSPVIRKRNVVRSGSITENIIDAGGVRKVILETNSSSDDPEADSKQNEIPEQHPNGGKANDGAPAKSENGKKKRRRKRKGSSKDDHAVASSGSQDEH